MAVCPSVQVLNTKLRQVTEMVTQSRGVNETHTPTERKGGQPWRETRGRRHIAGNENLASNTSSVAARSTRWAHPPRPYRFLLRLPRGPSLSLIAMHYSHPSALTLSTALVISLLQHGYCSLSLSAPHCTSPRLPSAPRPTVGSFVLQVSTINQPFSGCHMTVNVSGYSLVTTPNTATKTTCVNDSFMVGSTKLQILSYDFILGIQKTCTKLLLVTLVDRSLVQSLVGVSNLHPYLRLPQNKLSKNIHVSVSSETPIDPYCRCECGNGGCVL